MPLPPSGADMVNRVKSRAFTAIDFGLRNNGRKPNNIAGAIQYNSSKPTGKKTLPILNLQEKLNNLVFSLSSASTYFNTINQLLSNQPIPTIVTTVVTSELRSYFYNIGITLTTGTSILNLATTNQNGLQVFDIAQIEQINPGTNHYIYFSDNKPIKIGNATIEIVVNAGSKKLRVTAVDGNSTIKNFGDEITIEGEKFQFLGSGSGGLFIYKGRNYGIVNTTNTVTSEINNPRSNNIDGIALDSAKNIYIADYGNNRVLKFSNQGTLIKTYESQLFDNPRGIAIDSADNIYVTNYNANTLVKINATTDIITKVLDNIEKPYGICYNDTTDQRFYITCDGSVKVAGPHPTSGIFGILNSYNIFDGYILKGITVDSSGNNIYVVSENPNQIIKINTTSGIATPYYSFFNSDNTTKPNGITIDSSNNLYLVLSGKNKIIKITSENGNVSGVDFVNNNDLNNPQGIVYDSLSNIFYITNKIGINPVLIFKNRYAALRNNGFPTNGQIKWICTNNKYNENEFYVLVNVTDSSQNIHSVYSCSITLRGAVYTKIFDYIKTSPMCITSDTLGNIYITNYGNSSNKELAGVYKYDINTKVLSTLGVIELTINVGSSSDNIYGIEYSNGYIYFSNSSRIYRINLSDGAQAVPFSFQINGENTFLSSNKSNGHIFVYDKTPQITITEIKISQFNSLTNPNPIETYFTKQSNIDIMGFVKTSDDNSIYFIHANKLYKVTPSGGISNEIRQYADIDFKRLTHCVLDSNNKLYVIDGNINIYSLDDKTPISSNITLPTNNIKQGFLPSTINYSQVTTLSIQEQFDDILDLTVDKQDNVFYVGSKDSNDIRKVTTPTGSIEIVRLKPYLIGTGREPPNGDSRPSNIAISSNGDLFIRYPNQIKKVKKLSNGSYKEEDYDIVGGRNYFYSNNIGDLFIDRNDILYYNDTGTTLIIRNKTKTLEAGDDIYDILRDKIQTSNKFCLDLNGNILMIDSIGIKRSIPEVNRSIPQVNASMLLGSGGYIYTDLIVDSFNNVFCIDKTNYCIRKITPEGVNTVFAGGDVKGYVDGFGTNAKFNSPNRIAIDSNDNVFVADGGKIRKVSTRGNTFYIGDSNSIIKHVSNTSKNFNSNIGIFDNPKALVKDSNGNIFVLSIGDKTIYKINSNQNTTSYATNLPSPNGGMAIDTNGNIYITNLDNTISKINSNGTVETFITSVQAGTLLKNPIELIIDSTNSNMYILNKLGSIAKVIISTTVISELVGNLPSKISGLAIDSSNNLYFLNQSDNAIAKVTDGTLTSSFISGIINATDIFHENDKLYILTIDRKYYLIDLSQTPPTYTLSIINNEIYNPSIPITTSTSITQPVKIPDGTEYVNFVLIGGGGGSGGGSGAQLKFRIRVGQNSNNDNEKYLKYFKFEVGKGGTLNKDGGDTKVNFFSDEEGTQYSLLKITDVNNTYNPLPLKDVFIAGGGKSGLNGGLGGKFPKIFSGNKLGLNLLDNPIQTIVDINAGLVPSQAIEGLITANDLINIRGSLYGINGSSGDPLFNIFGLGGDLNSNIYTSYTDFNNEINIGTPTNTLNGNFKKISSTSSSKNFDLSLYSPGKGGDFDLPGNDGLVAWFFEGPSQYTQETLDPLFKVPRSLINQKFDNKWFTLLYSSSNNGIYNITIPEGVTKVDYAMIGGGGNSGPYIREPLFVPTTEITFSIELKYRDYYNVTHGPIATFYDNVPPAGETTNKEIINLFNILISKGTYTLTELCNEINKQIDQQTNGYNRNIGNLRFTILTKENYMGTTQTDPKAYYGFITDNLEMQDFTTGQWDFAGTNIYTKREIGEYTMKLTNVTNNSFLFRTDMEDTFGREFNVSNGLAFGRRVSSLYFPSLLRQPINQVIPDHSTFFGVNNIDKHPRHILPSFDGGDGNNGKYERRILDVVPGDTLEIKIGTSPSIQYGRDSLTNNNIFSSYETLSNEHDGNTTEIIHKRNSITQSINFSLGGFGGLSNDRNRLQNDQTIINKPGLRSGSFAYPTIVPPGWQDGYGKGGTTYRTLDTYDNPEVRGSNGCVMIKFS